MQLKIKTFEQLTKEELYEILRLRMEVFVVEQGGRYQDLDQIDYESTHIFIQDDQNEMVGCVRIFNKQDEIGTVQVGRLATRLRNQKIGMTLMKKVETEARQRYDAKELYLTGRHSALGFYIKCGYEVVSKELGTLESPYYEFRKTIKKDC